MTGHQRLARTLMIQGTSSAVGKSLLCAALGRVFRDQGFHVAPFKAQTLALNAAVTAAGHEIGRAQALQAAACGAEPGPDMNPVLLKPEGDNRTQVVLQGKAWRSVGPGEWDEVRPRLWEAITESLQRLRAAHDLVLIEGAGSPVEINLKKNEIVNMRVALSCGAPVVLAASAELGGMFAAIVGTLALLEPAERDLVKGFIVNRFRGDPRFIADGVTMLESLTGKRSFGTMPFLDDLRLPQEDGAALPTGVVRGGPRARLPGCVDIAVLGLPHASNMDDLDPLAAEAGVTVRLVESAEDLGRPDAVLVPGSKATLADLAWLTARGFPHAVRALADAGAAVAGICGGYQVLGLVVRDPRGSEGAPGTHRGLGLLPVETELAAEKTTSRVRAAVHGSDGFLADCAGEALAGYEIHRGQTTPCGPVGPLFMREDGSPDGAAVRGGRVWGTYIHGVFDADGFRRAWLHSLGWAPFPVGPTPGEPAPGGPYPVDGPGHPVPRTLERELDRLSAAAAAALDVDGLRGIAGL